MAHPTEDIKAYLDLVLLSLEALTGLSSEAVLQVAQDLKLDQILTDRIALWRLRQSSPLRKGKGGRKKLDVEEALALVRVSAQLAAQRHQEIRDAVARLERCVQQKQSPHRDGYLGNYLDRFHALYSERMQENHLPSAEGMQQLALKLLVDLVFYSSPAGVKRLWISLLETK